jgi:hypothetical protein
MHIFRDFRLFLDGQEIIHIADGQTLELNVTPGRHLFFAKIDWFSSKTIEFEVNDNDTKSFVLSNYNKLFRNLFQIGNLILVFVIGYYLPKYIALAFVPIFLLIIYNSTIGRKNYLTLIELNDNSLTNEAK